MRKLDKSMDGVPSPRIAIGGFLHQTNTFAPTMAGLTAFEGGGGWPPLSQGADIFAATRGIDLAVRGFIEEAERRAWTIVPTLWCAALSSAHVTEDAFEQIAERLTRAVAAALPLDGVYLDLHGAMVAEHLEDGDGELLARLREVIGPTVPLVASLDLHGNVSPAMVEHTDALVGCRTYPHIDLAETGRRAAMLLAPMLAGARHAKAFAQLPFLIPMAWQSTQSEPNTAIYRMVAELQTDAVVSTSFFCGFPAADTPDCGPSVLAYGETQAAADAAVARISQKIRAARLAYAGRAYEPLEAVREAQRIGAATLRPVVIADTQDDPDTGGDSNTMGMFKALLEAGAERAAIGAIFDPAIAQLAHKAGVGATIVGSLGGAKGVVGDSSYAGIFSVIALSDGDIQAKGPFCRGDLMRLGPSACIEAGGVSIVVVSRKAQMVDREMFRFVGIEPETRSILVVKSAGHFTADFAPIACAILVATAPGPMPLSPAALPFTKLRRGIDLSPTGPAFV